MNGTVYGHEITQRIGKLTARKISKRTVDIVDLTDIVGGYASDLNTIFGRWPTQNYNN